MCTMFSSKAATRKVIDQTAIVHSWLWSVKEGSVSRVSEIQVLLSVRHAQATRNEETINQINIARCQFYSSNNSLSIYSQSPIDLSILMICRCKQ